MKQDYNTEIIKFQGNDKYITMLVKHTIKEKDEVEDVSYRLIFGPIKSIDFSSESEEYRAGNTLLFGPRLYQLILTLDKKNNSALCMIDIDRPEEYELAIKILENML